MSDEISPALPHWLDNGGNVSSCLVTEGMVVWVPGIKEIGKYCFAIEPVGQ